MPRREGNIDGAGRRERAERLLAGGLLRLQPDATRFSGLSRTTLYGLMDSGQLPYVKLGKSRRIPHVALEALLAANLMERPLTASRNPLGLKLEGAKPTKEGGTPN